MCGGVSVAGRFEFNVQAGVGFYLLDGEVCVPGGV